MGTQFSPIVEAFLRGQAQQGDLTNQAQSIADRKKQIDAAIKEAQQRHDLDQERLALDHQIFELNFKKAQMDAHNNVVEQLKSNPELAPGTTNFEAPGQRMAIPGMAAALPSGGTPGSPAFDIIRTSGSEEQGPGQMVTTTPRPGTPVTMDIPGFGPTTVPMPESDTAKAIRQAKAVQDALLPGKVREYEATQGKSKELSYENALNIANLRADFEREMAGIRERASNYSADQRVAAAETRAFLDAQRMLWQMGFSDQGDVAKIAARVLHGDLGMADVPTQAKGLVDAAIGKLGGVIPPKGIGENLASMATVGNQLLSNFDELNRQYPAGKQAVDRLGNAIVGGGKYNPIANMTDMGQTFNLFGSNVTKYANETGETPGMARSPYFGAKAMAAAPGVTDTPTVRASKRNKIIDLAFSKAQAATGNLSLSQRQQFWRDFINNFPAIRNNAAYSDFISRVIRTGQYDSGYLNEKNDK